MHRFLSTTAIAGAALAVALIGTPASAAPDAAAAPTGTYTLAKRLPLPSPPPPRIPPPRCVPEDQANNNYEWRYSKTKKLGSEDRGFLVSHEFSISYAGKGELLDLSTTVSCRADIPAESAGRAGSGLGL
jgi:hypothetical protein